MTIPISDVTRRVVYSGSAGTGPYSFSFEILDEGDIAVYENDTLLTITTDYTVTINADGTGSVTLVTASTSDDTVAILGNKGIERQTDFVTGGDLFASSLNDELDAQTIFAQQNSEAVGRAIKIPPQSSLSIDTTLPVPQGNYVLGWNDTGDAILNLQELGVYQGTDATTTTAAYNNRDLIKSTTAAQLNNVYICTAASEVGDLLTDTDHFELIIDAVSAATSATNAATSATAAATSATAAQTAQTAAETAETNAETAETNAETAQTAAETAQTAAETAQTAAETAQTAAETAETNAETSETNASASATSAATSASTATTKASEASTSATNAATSASTATTKASEASTSATNAATSESNAATSATNAATSATNAATSATNAQAALDSIENFYLGASATAPTVDDNGDPLAAGDWYFNTTDNKTYIYNGSSWQVTVEDTSGFVATSGDTMTGDLSFGDNDKAIFGAGSDLQIYHDGQSRIKDAGSGHLILMADADVRITDSSGNETKASFVTDGAVSLSYNGSTKLATTSTGVSVTGTVTADGVSLGDNEKAQFGASNDLQIYHDGSSSYIKDAGAGYLLIDGSNQVRIRTADGTENHVVCVTNGAVNLYHDNSKKLETTSTGVDVTGTIEATRGIGNTNTDTSNTGSVTLDFSANQNFVLTLTGNVTLANPTTEAVGQSGFIVFIQDSTGGRTVSLGTDYETAGGAGLTLSSTASTTDVVPYIVAASGRILLGAPQLAFS